MANILSIHYDEKLRCLECLHCFEKQEISPRTFNDPEAFLTMMELTALDHQDCASYGSVESAMNARRFRKEKDRRALTAPRRTRP